MTDKYDDHGVIPRDKMERMMDISHTQVHSQMLLTHARVIAAHCECLGMNAENMWSAIANMGPVYRNKHYCEMMQKWGLIDEKGKPLI